MITAAPLDTTIAVVTPENIAFEYQLAGPFRRIPAYAIDVLVRCGLIVGFGMILVMLGVGSQMLIPGSFLFAALLVGYFLISWFYGTLLETYFNGRTIGKWALGLRVIGVDGRPLDGTRAVIRNLLRIADFAPMAALSQLNAELPPVFLIPTGMVGLVCMICTRRMQRLGDLAAGTMVVVDERSWQLPVTHIDDPRAAALASFVPADYRVSRTLARTLATYVERRAYLTPPRRREVSRVLAEPLLQRFGFRPDVDPDLLMMAMYHATFLSDSRPTDAASARVAGPSPLLRDLAVPPTAGLPAPVSGFPTAMGLPAAVAGTVATAPDSIAANAEGTS